MFTVILADDEPYILEGLEKKVDWTTLGFKIIGTAANGIECLDLIKNLHPDLVITDIRMPGLNGLHLLEKIRAADTRTVVIFISGYSEFNYAKRAIELGVLAYILKPIGKAELIAVLTRAQKTIEMRKQETKNKEEKESEELIEFLTSSPPGTKKSLVFNRLGIPGRYEAFLCLAFCPDNKAEGLERLCGYHGDYAEINPNSQLRLLLINAPPHAREPLQNDVSVYCRKNTVAAGLSPLGNGIQDIPELIRIARSLNLSPFITGEKRLYSSEEYGKPILGAIIEDFDILFSIGNEGKLHRLLDELKSICKSGRTSVQELVVFYNGFMEMCNRYSLSRSTQCFMDTPIIEPELLPHRFENVENLIEHLHSIIHHLFEAVSHGALNRTSSPDTVAALKQYIRRNIDAELNSENLSAAFQLEKDHIASMFKSETGKSLTEFIRETRIEHACFLLHHTRLSIQEISDMCGFSDYFYFAKLFRKEKGTTASDYRRKKNS
ncbi:response regulator [Marispirochaeta aestuarii]|uniref:response regulator transcription factor n=1 Tax=Marispirochaeta aestuarii TaxID=1963862 RepID=UPI0029C70CCB|nr:response regulator [Marispirochaeta aestuarii]